MAPPQPTQVGAVTVGASQYLTNLPSILNMAAPAASAEAADTAAPTIAVFPTDTTVPTEIPRAHQHADPHPDTHVHFTPDPNDHTYDRAFPDCVFRERVEGPGNP